MGSSLPALRPAVPLPSVGVRLMAARRREPTRQLTRRPKTAPTSLGLVKAVAHPVRRRVLRALHDASEARSPRELSNALGVHLSTVSYHVRILREVHALALTDVIPVRGTVESFYVSVVDGDGWLLSVLDDSRRQDGEG